MQKSCFSKIFGVSIIIGAVVFISSCVSRPPVYKYNMQAFGAVGTDADAYIFVPVAGNEPLLKQPCSI